MPPGVAAPDALHAWQPQPKQDGGADDRQARAGRPPNPGDITRLQPADCPNSSSRLVHGNPADPVTPRRDLGGRVRLLPDTDPTGRLEPQLVVGTDAKRAVELVEVPHDLIAAEFARRVRVGGEPPDDFLVPGLLPPGTSPR